MKVVFPEGLGPKRGYTPYTAKYVNRQENLVTNTKLRREGCLQDRIEIEEMQTQRHGSLVLTFICKPRDTSLLSFPEKKTNQAP